MLYVLIGEDAPGSLDKRLAARGEHVARLQALQADGRLVLAGPCPAIDANDPGPAGFTGSVIIAEFPSLADAEAWAAAVNDVRLALGTMLDVGSGGPDELPPEHPMAGHVDVYQWLTVLQEYLVLAMMGKR